jgi:hypothetical protein
MHAFSLTWKIDPNISIYTKTALIIYKLSCRTCLLQCNYFMELGAKEKGKENDRATVISHTTRHEGRGYKNVH